MLDEKKNVDEHMFAGQYNIYIYWSTFSVNVHSFWKNLPATRLLLEIIKQCNTGDWAAAKDVWLLQTKQFRYTKAVKQTCWNIWVSELDGCVNDLSDLLEYQRTLTVSEVNIQRMNKITHTRL